MGTERHSSALPYKYQLMEGRGLLLLEQQSEGGSTGESSSAAKYYTKDQELIKEGIVEKE
jgi:hypothetical protein